MKLGALLIQDGVITVDQLEGALRSQVLAGGKLGTHLVQLGHLTADMLSTYLSRALGIPAATEQMIEHAQTEAIKAIPTRLVAHHHACPLRFVAEGSGRALEVAFVDPEDGPARRSLEVAAAVPILALVAPEILVDRALERYYGLPSRVRNLPVRPLDSTLRPLRASPFAIAPTPFSEAMALAEQATDPLGVAQAVVRYARGRVEAAVFFLVDERQAVGWLGFAPGMEESAVPRIAITLGVPSAISSAVLARTPRRIAPDDRLDRQIAGSLGAIRAPDEVLVAPLLWRGRAYAVFWCHARSLKPFADAFVDCVGALLAPAG